MPITVTIPDTYTFQVSKINEARTVTLKPDYVALVSHAVMFGLRQMTANAHASIKRESYKTDAEFKSAVTIAANGQVAKFNRGELPGGTKSAPVTQESATAFLAGLSEKERVALMAEAARLAKLAAA